MADLRFSSVWEKLRSSYWFVPAVMILGATLLSAVTIWLDRSAGISDRWFILYSAGPSGARSLLSTTATSMITVAGVVFSMTIVALSFASAHLGPRLLRNFMRDRGNQVVLGTFIATFVYCLLILRTVSDQEEGFVPHVSTTAAVMLALASLGVLIYFIHHMAQSIQADYVIAIVAGELDHSIRNLYPGGIGEEPSSERSDELARAEKELRSRPAIQVPAKEPGYIHALDLERLMKIARRHDLTVRILSRPGRYVHDGTPVAEMWPDKAATAKVCGEIQAVFVLGRMRTSQQDVEFAINQLVEVALRALSPSLNDPFTAVACIDRLSTALLHLMRRDFPDPFRLDQEGRLRVIAERGDFGGVVDAAFHQIRQAGASMPSVMIHLLEALTFLLEHSRTEEHRRALNRHVELVRRAGIRGSAEEADQADITERALAAGSPEPVVTLAGQQEVQPVQRGER